jgi:hypothetical protein
MFVMQVLIPKYLVLGISSQRASVPSSPILVTLTKEALSPSKTFVLARATRRNILEDAILHSHRRENLRSYILGYCLCFLIINLAM